MKVLITGASGLLAPYIKLEGENEQHEVYTTSHKDLDLTDPRSMGLLPKVDVLIHCAALTSVGQCEDDPMLAVRLNSTMTALLAHSGVADKFVYISTDQVYPDERGPHGESLVGPVNMYGKSKLAGEKAVRDNCPSHLILRTNFFGKSLTEGRESFSDWVIRLLKEKHPLKLYSDILFSPLRMLTVSWAIFELLDKSVEGTYNLGSREGFSKAQFAQRVAEHMGLDVGEARFVPAPTGPVKRPHDMRMDVSKIEEALGHDMPTLEEEIEKL